MEKTVNAVDGVVVVTEVRARWVVGPRLFAQVQLSVDGALSVTKGHESARSPRTSSSTTFRTCPTPASISILQPSGSTLTPNGAPRSQRKPVRGPDTAVTDIRLRRVTRKRNAHEIPTRTSIPLKIDLFPRQVDQTSSRPEKSACHHSSLRGPRSSLTKNQCAGSLCKGRSVQAAGLNRVTPAAQYMAVGKDPPNAVEPGEART
jgi:hypothetical protein